MDNSDPEFFNPAAHVRVKNAWGSGLAHCSCSWVGVSFEMHVVAMHSTYDVLVPHLIEEEE